MRPTNTTASLVTGALHALGIDRRLGRVRVIVVEPGAGFDHVFIAALQDSGFPSVNRSTITGLGRSICDQLHNGVGFTKVATIGLDSGFTPAQTGNLMGAGGD